MLVTSSLFFVDGTNLALPVEAAVRTHPVRRLRFVALRTEIRGHGRERVVRAALGRASLRVSAFWIWHDDSIYDSLVLSACSAARRGSTHPWVHEHWLTFRFVPHCGHRPLQSSLQSGFIGRAR